jgi:small subunit ribosomal protein S3Ae
MVREKGKKRWFTVLTPELFGSKELSEIAGYSTEELIGRGVEVTGQMLTTLPKDANRKYILLITGAKGDKMLTLPVKYYLTSSFIFRTVRKYKERETFVLYPKTKDGFELRVKLQFLNPSRLHRSERGALLKKLKELLPAKTAEYASDKIFEPDTIEKLANDLKKDLAEVKPISKILIHAISIRNPKAILQTTAK